MFKGRAAIVWSALMGATLVSWFLGGHSVSSGQVLIGSVVLVIAFVKVYLVGVYFMELRDAPTVLRAIFGCYCVVVCAVLIGILSLM
jgi:caa(3)-type oxidase subunit IV